MSIEKNDAVAFVTTLGNIYRNNNPDRLNFHGGYLGLLRWGLRNGLVTDEEFDTVWEHLRQLNKEGMVRFR